MVVVLDSQKELRRLDKADELRAIAFVVLALRAARALQHVVERGVALELGVLEEQRELGDGGGEAEALGRLLARDGGFDAGCLAEDARVAVRLLPAQLDREGLLARDGFRLLVLERVDVRDFLLRSCGNDFVKGRHRVARANLAGVLLVVVEVLGFEQAVLVAEEPVA